MFRQDQMHAGSTETAVEGASPAAGHAALARDLLAALGGIDHPLAMVPLAGLPAVAGGLAAWAQSAEWQQALAAGDGWGAGGGGGEGGAEGAAGDAWGESGAGGAGGDAWGEPGAGGAGGDGGARGAGGEEVTDPSRVVPTPWSKVVRQHFAQWAGADGFLSDDELLALMADPTIGGDAAAALAVVHARASELESLSDDELGIEDDGMTLADLVAYEQAVASGRLMGGDHMFRNVAKRLQETPEALFTDQDQRVDATAVKQGKITDCYFLAALVGRASASPSSIAKMITDHGDGRYTVDFPGTGRVTIDGPTDAEIARYSTSGADGRWLAVIEKAYARSRSDAHESDPYDAIDSPSLGSTGLAPLVTAGTDTDFLAVTRLEVTREKMLSAIEGRRIVTAGVSLPNELGLPPQHIYTVLAFDGRTVTIRNPWGQQGGARDTDRDGIVELSLEEFDDVFTWVCYESAPPGTPDLCR